MNEVELTIRLSNEYDTCFDRVRDFTELHKCHCWFDRKDVINNEVTVKLTMHGIIIRYRTSKGQVQESCTYDSVLSVTEIYDGIILRMSHKRMLFLQAANDRKETELLIQAVYLLEENCKYFFIKSHLFIGKAGLLTQIKYRIRPKRSFCNGGGYVNIGAILLICATVFIATVFVLQPVNNRIILESEAISVVATYSGYDPSYGRHGSIKYIDLEFEDYEELTVDGCCVNSGFVEQLEEFPVGTKMIILVHPKSKNVLQLDVNGDILLEFNDSQNRVWREAVGFTVMGLLMYVVAAGLLIGMIRKKL